MMNRFRTGQGPCRANLHKWGLAIWRGQRQTIYLFVYLFSIREHRQ